MTLAQAKAQVKALGLRLTKDTATEEYTVHTATCLNHMSCYFTDDLQDALDTASHMAKPTKTYTYITDDWLVIRTDSEGHQACVNTECWPEWGPIVGIGERPADETPYKKAVIERAIRMKSSNWLGCADGWCGKCESSVQSGDFD